MKLRVRGNSLRLRLTRPEVAALRNGPVVERLELPGGTALEYRLQAADVAAPEADLAGTVLAVRVPADAAREWVDGEGVSLAGEQPLPSGGTLSILVEKDFACLAERPGEDDSDAYPNPRASD